MEDCVSDDLTPRKNIFGKALVGIAPQFEMKFVRIVMKEVELLGTRKRG